METVVYVPLPQYTIPNREGYEQELIQSGDDMISLDGWGGVYGYELVWISVEDIFGRPFCYYAGNVFKQNPSGCTDNFNSDTDDLLYSVTSPIVEPSTGLMLHCHKVYLLELAGEFLRVHQFDIPGAGPYQFVVFRLNSEVLTTIKMLIGPRSVPSMTKCYSL